MQKKFFFIILMVTLVSPGSRLWATAPQSIEIVYDEPKKMVHLTVSHPTRDLQEHRIRKIQVSLKDHPPQNYFFSAQQKATAQVLDVPALLNSGDTVKVKAICSKAGFKEQTYTIP